MTERRRALPPAAPFPRRAADALSQVNKVNRKGKTQRRALIITNLAVYNFKTNDYGSFMRRIPIADLGSFIRVKGEPTVFVLHTWCVAPLPRRPPDTPGAQCRADRCFALPTTSQGARVRL